MSAGITWQQAKQLVLNWLNWRLQQIPVSQRTAPTLQFDFQSWSYPDMIAQVSMDTYVGQRYVGYQIRNIGDYVIVG